MGGRLVAGLEQAGATLRCLARRPEALAGRVAASTEVVRGDCLDPATLPAALAGVDTAYYLVHSMGSGREFEAGRRRRSSLRIRRTRGWRPPDHVPGRSRGGRATDLRRICAAGGRSGTYFGREGYVVELRASVMLGSGSLSFELIRALVERLPVMICPRWVAVRTQPIAMDDLVA